ncbi:MAG: tRNA (guanosine(37)-N1)-methyltransferase TrmD [Acidobacteriota bacterium]
MRIQILTIFPELFGPFLATSLVGRAIDRGLMQVGVHDLRDFTTDRHRSVDDEPYGGGGGMVMTAEPFLNAVAQLSASPAGAGDPSGGAGCAAGDGASQAVAGSEAAAARRPWCVLMSPQGERLAERKVRELAERRDLILLCGRYEGIDERVRQTVVDEEVSIGDFVLSGGELPAMVLVEAVSRQISGVVGLAESVERDSFRHGLLDFPHYTRPRHLEHGGEVPEVLLGGHHAAIEAWRDRQALEATVVKRPDLLADARLTEAQRQQAVAIAAEHGIDLPASLQRQRK